MGLKGWNIAVLAAIGALWFCGMTQREKPVFGDLSGRGRVGGLEARAAAHPTDAAALRELAQAYLDMHQPGLAVGVIERAAPATRDEPTVTHLYARALLDQGRSVAALAAEKRVLAACADGSSEVVCSTWLVASATRRADIVQELVQLGVEDANAHPEASSLAYHNATRQVSLAVYAQ
jgi:hypothetical protein